jgi:hypothetical protein
MHARQRDTPVTSIDVVFGDEDILGDVIREVGPTRSIADDQTPAYGVPGAKLVLTLASDMVFCSITSLVPGAERLRR